MRFAVTALLSAAAAGLCLAGDSHAVAREGEYWVQTATGALPLDARGRLHIATHGPAVVQGAERSDVAYTLQKRVRARNAAEAQRLLKLIAVKQIRSKRSPALSVVRETPGGVKLRIEVPRALRNLIVESREGALEIYDLDGAVHADSRGGRIHLDRIRGDVVVRTGGGPVQFGQIGGAVQCFSGGGSITAEMIGGDAGLNTAGGAISIRRAKGLVRAVTSGGSVRIERADRGVEATVRAGIIDVLSARGPVIAHSESGPIRVRSAGNLQCQTRSGTIHLAAVYGGMRVLTNRGDIVAELAPKPLEDSTLTAGAGDITVLIPSNLSVTVQTISAYSSYPGAPRVISDFPGDSRNDSRIAINGGGPLLRLAASGTVYLRRQK